MTVAQQFAEAFYGGALPDSRLNVASQDVMRVVMALKGDIRNKVGAVDDNLMNKAILSALGLMHNIQVRDIDVYTRDSVVATRVFNHAVEVIQDRQTLQEMASELVSHREGQLEMREAILSRYAKLVDNVRDSGVEHYKFEAWRTLYEEARTQWDLGGYPYYIIVFKIPTMHEFFYLEAFAQFCKDTPGLPDRKPKSIGMHINGKRWDGKRLEDRK